MGLKLHNNKAYLANIKKLEDLHLEAKTGVDHQQHLQKQQHVIEACSSTATEFTVVRNWDNLVKKLFLSNH